MRLEAVIECEHGRAKPHLTEFGPLCEVGTRRVASTTDVAEWMKEWGATEVNAMRWEYPPHQGIIEMPQPGRYLVFPLGGAK